MAERSSDPSGASFLRAGAGVTERWGGAREPSPSRRHTQEYTRLDGVGSALGAWKEAQSPRGALFHLTRPGPARSR